VEFVAPFLKSLILVPLTLLPIINPLTAAPVFIGIAGSNPLVVRRMARQIAFNSWCELVVSMLVGIYVLDIFGISLPIVRIGGGLLVAASGWRLLNSTGETDVQKAVAHRPTDLTRTEIVRRSFSTNSFRCSICSLRVRSSSPCSASFWRCAANSASRVASSASC